MYRGTMHDLMIGSTKSKLAAGAVADRYSKRLPANLIERTRVLLSALDAAVELSDLRFSTGDRLEQLEGGRAVQYSIRINDQWRICYAWTEYGPADVEIVD